MHKGFEKETRDVPNQTENAEAEPFEYLAAQQAIAESKWKRLIDDENVREGASALLRTLANVGISLGDIVPGIGEAASWTADAMKVIGPKLQRLGMPINIDLTPDVSKAVALGSEALEYASFGVAPTHSIETLLQMRHDVPRMRAALQTIRAILHPETKNYTDNKEDIDNAIATFDGTNSEE